VDPVVRDIQQQLGEQLCYVFRHFPRIDLHPQAHQAAKAAEAAAKQGKFWQMHNCLFINQHALQDGDLAEYADALELDVMQFLRDLSGDVHAPRVQEDWQSGVQSGVYQTPTFFINCLRYDNICDRSTLLAALTSQALTSQS
ncbi:MAG TPA: DsbA family protein, partial [Coleofasciculaceae cyanobacterium]